MKLMALFSRIQGFPPTSDENIIVRDTTFNDIPVRIYVPQQKTKSLRRGLFYIHGGGWCLGSNGKDDMLKDSLHIMYMITIIL